MAATICAVLTAGSVLVSCSEESSAPQAVRPPLSPREYAQNLLHPSEEKRREAFRALAVYGPEAKPAIPALIEAFESPDPKVRRSAALVLGKIGEAAVAPLTEVLTTNMEPLIQAGCAESLGEIGAPAEVAIPDLVNLLQDPVAEVRAAAALGMGQIGGALAPAQVGQAIKIENQELIDLTKAVLDGSGNSSLSANVREKQTQPGQTRQILNSFGVGDQLIGGQLPDEAPPEVTVQLSYGGNSEILQKIIPVLALMLYDDSALVQASAARGLGEIGPAAAGTSDDLLEVLYQYDEEGKCNAAWALGEIGTTSPSAIAALKSVAHDSRPAVRTAVAKALFKLEHPGK